jgi:hypothetical protein
MPLWRKGVNVAKRNKTQRQRILVLNEPYALRINAALAQEIGLNESIVLLQLDYLISISTSPEHDGKQWTYQSLEEWRNSFPFWSQDTIDRAIKSLQAKGLIHVDRFNQKKYDRTRWFALDFEGIAKLTSISVHQEAKATPQNAVIEEGNLRLSNTADCGDRMGQNAEIEHRKIQGSNGANCGDRTPQNRTTIPETTPETYAETSTEVSAVEYNRDNNKRDDVKNQKQPVDGALLSQAPQPEKLKVIRSRVKADTQPQSPVQGNADVYADVDGGQDSAVPQQHSVAVFYNQQGEPVPHEAILQLAEFADDLKVHEFGKLCFKLTIYMSTKVEELMKFLAEEGYILPFYEEFLADVILDMYLPF